MAYRRAVARWYSSGQSPPDAATLVLRMNWMEMTWPGRRPRWRCRRVTGSPSRAVLVRLSDLLRSLLYGFFPRVFHGGFPAFFSASSIGQLWFSSSGCRTCRGQFVRPPSFSGVRHQWPLRYANYTGDPASSVRGWRLPTDDENKLDLPGRWTVSATDVSWRPFCRRDTQGRRYRGRTSVLCDSRRPLPRRDSSAAVPRTPTPVARDPASPSWTATGCRRAGHGLRMCRKRRAAPMAASVREDAVELYRDIHHANSSQTGLYLTESQGVWSPPTRGSWPQKVLQHLFGGRL